jgi:hypothetical protein
MSEDTEPLFKDFDIILAERREKNKGKVGPTFQLMGQLFQCKPKLSAQAAIVLGRLTRDADAQSLLDFIHAVLIKADRSRFDALIDDDEDGDIDVELLGDIISTTIEGFSGRPTDGSSD